MAAGDMCQSLPRRQWAVASGCHGVCRNLLCYAMQIELVTNTWCPLLPLARTPGPGDAAPFTAPTPPLNDDGPTEMFVAVTTTGKLHQPSGERGPEPDSSQQCRQGTVHRQGSAAQAGIGHKPTIGQTTVQGICRTADPRDRQRNTAEP